MNQLFGLQHRGDRYLGIEDIAIRNDGDFWGSYQISSAV